MFRRILRELKAHAPFTAIGAASGIIVMAIILIVDVPASTSEAVFYTLHPLHVVLSALVTTAIYRRYSHGRLWKAILIGYCGSVGIATLSDAVIPYLEGALFNIPLEFHLPFLETGPFPYLGIPKWVVVNGAAAIGIGIGYWKQFTKFPHSGHVLLSTWASLFNFAAFGIISWAQLPLIFVFLFLAVWLPCCLSDIAFPLLFIRKVASGQDMAYTGHQH
jgi:hypothetical protein